MLRPNPVGDRLFVDGAAGSLQLFGADGRHWPVTGNREAGLDVSGLPAGIYFLRMDGELRRFVKR